jgi:outer membrane lipoprotein-sorting protein
MKSSILLRVAAAGLAILPAASVTAAPTAKEIITKARSAMKGLKSYQATVHTTMTGGPMPMSIIAQIKTAGGKTWAKMTTPPPSGQGQPNPFAAMLQNMVVVDDGKNSWTYMPSMKQYRKGPSGQANQFNFSDQLLGKIDQEATLTYGGTETVAGHPTYVIQASPKQKRPGSSETVRMNFDQSTYLLVQAKANQSGAATANMPARNQSVTILVKDQKVNQPIPDSVFKFTPPAGATEMQGGGMGMGMPGGARPGK